MILPKWDTLTLLQNEGYSKDGRDAAWSKRKREEEGRQKKFWSRTGHPVLAGHPVKEIVSWIAHGQEATEAPDIRWTGHPVTTGHPVAQMALWIAAGRTTLKASDSRTTGHPVATGHPADRTSGRNRTSGACPSPAGNQVLLVI